MLLKCLTDHVHQEVHFESGQVYEVDDIQGGRLLKDYGPGDNDNARRGGTPRFEPFVQPEKGHKEEVVDVRSIAELTPGQAIETPPEHATQAPTPDPEHPDTSAKDALRAQTAANQSPTRPTPTPEKKD